MGRHARNRAVGRRRSRRSAVTAELLRQRRRQGAEFVAVAGGEEVGGLARAAGGDPEFEDLAAGPVGAVAVGLDPDDVAARLGPVAGAVLRVGGWSWVVGRACANCGCSSLVSRQSSLVVGCPLRSSLCRTP